MQWFDSHCHFDFDEFDPDRRQVCERMRAAGIQNVMIPGVEPAQWPRAKAVAEKESGFVFAAGLHPWWVSGYLEEKRETAQADLLTAMQACATDPLCKAIGECGLDALRDTPMNLQEEVFEWHVRAACDLEMPLIVHCVKAHNPVIRILKKYQPCSGGVIHAFSGSVEIARTYFDLGFCLGVGGMITYERAHKTRNTLREVPLDYVVLETDAPSMPLCGRQGQRNNPDLLPLIGSQLAELRDNIVADIAAVTRANALRLFNIPH